ncbi:MAG: LPS export ABC transporter periplasmic protein LptC [Gammaproteobacteria bacterium]|nr:LPS export ABC transporter periplasmic protein LptC [Gammaproteobacteria bacterium]
MQLALRQRFGLIVLLTLAIVAAVSSWYRLQEEAPEIRDVRADQLPDAFFENIKLQMFDANGNLQIQLASDKIDAHIKRKQLIIDHPIMVFNETLRAPPKQWQLRADQARADEQLNELHLTGNVHLQSHSVQAPLELRAQTLYFWPDTAKLKTEGATQLVGAGWQLNSQSIDADIAAQHWELQKVKIRYER